MVEERVALNVKLCCTVGCTTLILIVRLPQPHHRGGYGRVESNPNPNGYGRVESSQVEDNRVKHSIVAQ